MWYNGAMAIYFYGCVTMDGYLADQDHGLGWLDQLAAGMEEADSSYPAFYEQMNVTIMGKKTFDYIAQLPGAEDFYAQTTNYVFTHAERLPIKGYRPVQGSVVELVKSLTTEQNVFVVGGTGLVADLLAADLFDHLIIQVAPAILGRGIPLFSQPAFTRYYQLDQVSQFGPFAELRFSRV